MLRGARRLEDPAGPAWDLLCEHGRVSALGNPSLPGTDGVDLAGGFLLPGLINAHDHLDLATLPALGQPPYPDLYAWTRDVVALTAGARPELRAALAVASVERLFLGGLRNLLAGVVAVLHHGRFHRALARADFPVRVQERYDFAHSPGLTTDLRGAYRTTDRRIPWYVHAGEGRDAGLAAELERLAAANVLRQNTVIVQGLAFANRAQAERLAAARACLVWQPEAAQRLYGAELDVETLLDAGVRVGLGSDGAATGVRDLLSTLASARGVWRRDDQALLQLASAGSGAVARLEPGAWSIGARADFVVTDDLRAFLQGQRRAVALVLQGGQARYGLPALLAQAEVRAGALRVEGQPMALEAGLARRARALWSAAGPALRATGWARDVEWT